MARDAYLEIDPGITFDTYLCAPICTQETVAQFVKYKFDDNPDMYMAITQFTVWNSPSNPTSKLKVNLEKLKSVPAQVKLLLDDLTKVKSNQKSTNDTVYNFKDRGS